MQRGCHWQLRPILSDTESCSGAAAAGAAKMNRNAANPMRPIARDGVIARIPLQSLSLPTGAPRSSTHQAYMTKRRRLWGAAACTTTEPAGLELVRNVVEGRVELVADALHRAN